jgi:pimeloyl-ACP methyl ester carboxylesterase
VSVATSEVFEFSSGPLRLTGERWDGGDPERAAVVLLHGGGQTRHSWKRTAARLASAGRTAIALDARGHGDSDWAPDGDYSLNAFVGDLVAFVEQVPRAPVLVGASLGGITSLMGVGTHPDLAIGLVLVDIVVKIEPAGVDRIRNFMTAQPDGFATLEDVADAIAVYNPHRPRPKSLDGLRKNVRLRDNGRWYWHWDPQFMQIDDEPQRRFHTGRLREAAAAVMIPTLLVRGGQSDVVSDAGLRDMLELIPHAEVADVGTAGHMVAGDDNDVFAVALESFLSRLG